MHTYSLAEYMKCIYRGDWRGVGELMLASANKLAKVGADFLICPDNTLHQHRTGVAGTKQPRAASSHRVPHPVGTRTFISSPSTQLPLSSIVPGRHGREGLADAIGRTFTDMFRAAVWGGNR
jgi:hypothetical protein